MRVTFESLTSIMVRRKLYNGVYQVRSEISVTFSSFQYSPETKNRNRYNRGSGKYPENNA